MLEKNRSHYGALVKYGFSAPLFALMLALSSATINNSTVVKNIHKEAIQIFEVPATALTNTPAVRTPVVTKDDLYTNIDSVEMLTVYEGINELKTTEPVNDVLIETGNDATDTHNEVFTAVEKLPEFAGGLPKFYEFLSRNLHYPADAVKNKASGRINVTFIIEKDGALTDIKALNNQESAIAQEAVRVISVSPKWIAGEQNGKPVRVQYTVPVVFSLDETGAAPDAGQSRNINIHNRKQADSGQVVAPPQTNVFSYNMNEKGADKLHLFIDGKEAPPGTSLASIDTRTIRSVSVFKNKTAVKMYGDQFKDRVIMITTLTTDKK
jgi:TonB family protein